MLSEIDRAIDALHSIPPDLERDSWVRAGMAAHAAGLDFETFNGWSAGAGNYNETAARDTWRSFKPGKGVGAGTLYKMAAEHGWRMNSEKPDLARRAIQRPIEAPTKPRPGMSATEIWKRCKAATNEHPYVVKKQAAGVPLEGLRVVPAGDSLTMQGERMAGALVVPVLQSDGAISSLQIIATPEVAKRLKAKDKPDKLNLPGHPVQGWFTVGEILPGGVAYIVEGIGTAWACWQATGAASVVCFGAGNMSKVAKALRERDPNARLVLVPDVGKEKQAAEIAAEVGGMVAAMPDGWAQNSDVHDLAQCEGMDALEALLISASSPTKAEPRYKLLNAGDLRDLPPLAWRVRGVLPAVGLAALYGPSASGKSFLGFDMAASIAEGQKWLTAV